MSRIDRGSKTQTRLLGLELWLLKQMEQRNRLLLQCANHHMFLDPVLGKFNEISSLSVPSKYQEVCIALALTHQQMLRRSDSEDVAKQFFERFESESPRRVTFATAVNNVI